MDICFCLVVVAAHLYHLFTSGSQPTARDCAAGSFVTQYFALAAELYYVMLSLDIVISILNPFTNHSRNMFLYHVAVHMLAAASGVLLLTTRWPSDGRVMYGRDGVLDICWVRRDGDHSSATPSAFLWLFFIGPLLAMQMLSLTSLIFMHVRLRRGLPQTFAVRRHPLPCL
jgi:hypothetical protein